jgi:hypothetical protein
MKLWSVKQLVFKDVKKDNRMVRTQDWEIVGNHLSFKDAKLLAKKNKGSSIFPDIAEPEVKLIPPIKLEIDNVDLKSVAKL